MGTMAGPALQSTDRQADDLAIEFEATYAALPERFREAVTPQPVRAPGLVRLNRALAAELGLDAEALESPAGVAMLAGNAFPASARPVALAYAGHQFGNFVPRLGDGRALLIGELRDRHGRLRDLQLKGSGPTRFSRGGDGRAALGPVLREYVVSEAMAALGIPTARTLAAVTTGEAVFRETALPGAVVARVAASHLRIGTFQYFAARDDREALETLTAFALERHYPHLKDMSRPALGLLKAVIDAQAELVARWMLVGFIHGVMNTDNMTISGETIDYGPCAFMDAYHPATVFSSIDRHGRYAYGNQPHIAVWNLARLAEALLPLIDPDGDRAVELATEALRTFQPAYDAVLHDGFRRKLGLHGEQSDDLKLASDLLETMAANGADFTLTFRTLAHDVASKPGEGAARGLFSAPEAFDAWHARWLERLSGEPMDMAERRRAMNAANPKFIARNHRVEAAIEAAVSRDDLEPFETLTRILERPFDEQPGLSHYADPPLEHERVMATFCGT